MILSTGGGCLVPGEGVPGPRGDAWSQGRGCLVPGGVVPVGLVLVGGAWSQGVPGGDPPGRLLLRAVRILLECILVQKIFL